MATFDNPNTDTTGTPEDDTFIFNQPIVNPSTYYITIAGGAGRDTLRFESTAQGRYSLTIGSDGQFSGEMVTLGGTTVRYSEFEVARFTGTNTSEGFSIVVGGPVDPADIFFDGQGGGNTGLAISMTNNAPLTFSASGPTATSSVGSFTNFDLYSLSLGGGDDNVSTGDGNDRVTLARGTDPTGRDVVFTGAGNDVLRFDFTGTVDTSMSSFDGGDGLDAFEYSNRSGSADVRFGVASDGTITSNLGTFTSFEVFRFTLGSGNDGVITGAGDDWINGRGGDDYIQTGAGDDILQGGSGTNTLIGGPGDDIYYIDNASDTLVELVGEGYDTVDTSVSYSLGLGSNLEALVGSGVGLILTGNELDNSITGTIGDDILIGGAGADVLDGRNPSGNDTVSYAGDGGAVFVNLTLGQGYTNTAFGDTYIEIDNVIGTDFDDFLIGDTNTNRLDGGAGNDTIIGAVGADVLVGGSGTDLLSFEDNSGVVFVNLLTGTGSNNAAEGDTFDGFENVIGGLFDDTLIGDDGANRLDGALGADTLVGNGGADTFVFAFAPGVASGFAAPFSSANVDTIFDFVSGQDMLEIKASAFGGGLAAGSVAAGSFVLGTVAGDADDRFIYDQANGKLYFDADGSGAGAQVLMALLPNHDAIAASDFVVV